MRLIAHISDLHFGRINSHMLPALAASIRAESPDLVVVSGDLTQRARTNQFLQAREFLQALPHPQLVVPGNHDIPLFNAISRWLSPLGKFRRYITADLEPFYSDDEIAVAGVNTARSWSFKDGRINAGQVARSCARLSSAPGSLTRLIVTHHPFALPTMASSQGIVGRAEMAITGFADCRVDMILSGHLHISHSAPSVARYGDTAHAALLVQAGTAISSRARGEPNAFNIIRIDRPNAIVEQRSWDDSGKTFVKTGTERFVCTANGWRPSAETIG